MDERPTIIATAALRESYDFEYGRARTSLTKTKTQILLLKFTIPTSGT